MTCDTNLCHVQGMRSVNLRQLRDTRQLKAWLKAGEVVELRERNEVLARIVPEPVETPAVEWPDAATRRQRIMGNKVLEINGVLESREDSRF